MLHPAGALEEREPRPNKENWHLTGYGAHENPILGRHPWTRFSLSAAVLCCSHLYGSRQRAGPTRHTTRAPQSGQRGTCRMPAWPAWPCLLIPARAAHPSTCACLGCGPALRGRKSLSSNSPRGGSTWRSPRDPVQGPYWAVGRNASYLRHGQGILTSHLTLDRPFGSQARRRPVAKGPHSKPPPPPGTATLSACPWGGAGTLFCILTPCASASRFEDKLRQGPRVIHPGIQLWTRWVR